MLYQFTKESKGKEKLKTPLEIIIELMKQLSQCEDCGDTNQETILEKFYEQHRDTTELSKDIQEQILAHHATKSAGDFDYHYGNIMREDRFRLFVDVNLQRKPSEGGFRGYESREPGSLDALENALGLIRESHSETLNADYIKQIHQLCAQAIPPIMTYVPCGWSSYYKKASIEPGCFKPSKFGSITMDLSTITPAGLETMMMNTKAYAYSYLGGSQLFRIHLGYPDGGYEQKVEQIIEQYHAAIDEATPLEVFRAILVMVQSLEQLHPFKDGNLRTFTMLMNRELVNHGFTPSLMDDPNRIDGHSIEELMVEVLKGMNNFIALKENGFIKGTLPNDMIYQDKDNSLEQSLDKLRI